MIKINNIFNLFLNIFIKLKNIKKYFIKNNLLFVKNDVKFNIILTFLIYRKLINYLNILSQ